MGWFSRGKQLVTADGISIELKPEDQPKFERVYKADIEGGFRVEISMRSWVFGRRDSSWLYQSNGKHILFDAKAVADRIIDRELYPRVQAVVDRILVLDEAFLKSKPSEFVDETGTTWYRK